MAISNFTELKAAIAGWTHRANLTGQIDDFVMLAEVRIFSDLKVKEMEARISYTPTSRYLSTPTRLTAIRRITAATTPPTELKSTSPDGLHVVYDSGSGTPTHYTVLGSEIEFNRIPNVDVEILHYAAPAALSESAPTNAILTAYPNIYLAACMVEAAGFIKDAAMAAQWGQAYADAIGNANRKSSKFHTAGPMAVSIE